jgi:hypothetical protein
MDADQPFSEDTDDDHLTVAWLSASRDVPGCFFFVEPAMYFNSCPAPKTVI